MAVTIRDVSKYCNLSVSTVSKALNHYPDISEKTRKRILECAREIGYYPNAIARALKTNRTYNIGVILDDEMHDSLMHTYFISILNGFRSEAEKYGYDITLINHHIAEQKMTYLDHCHYRNVDGICLVCVDFHSPEILELVQSDLPLVSIDHHFPGKECIMSDNKMGVTDLVDYIVDMGHRRIAYIYGTPSAVTDIKKAAFFEAIRQRGVDIPAEYILSSHYHSPYHASEDTKRLLSLETPPTVIMMVDDYSALGGIDTIGQLGLKIPDDISITGYDGISMIQKIRPRLTTMKQDGNEIGRQAASRLVSRILSPLSAAKSPGVVPSQLIEGETVRRIS